MSQYHLMASCRPFLTEYFGSYPSKDFALSIEARECGISPALNGPYTGEISSIAGSKPERPSGSHQMVLGQFKIKLFEIIVT